MPRTVDIHTHRYSQNADVCILNTSIGDHIDEQARNYYSAGIHPWKAGDHASTKTDWLEQILTSNKKVIAIGEIGLDKISNVEMSVQVDVFKKQLVIAEARHMPVIIHNVRATAEILALQQEIAPSIPFIFHGFRGKPAKALAILSKGNYISFGAAILLNDEATANSLIATPVERLFLETDDASTSITTIYARAAEIKGITEEQLISEIWNNFARLFKKHLHD